MRNLYYSQLRDVDSGNSHLKKVPVIKVVIRMAMSKIKKSITRNNLAIPGIDLNKA